jgi:hypothetical protein
MVLQLCVFRLGFFQDRDIGVKGRMAIVEANGGDLTSG